MIAGLPPVLVKDVEEKASELVRAAEALYLHGASYEGMSPQGGTAVVAGGMFDYQTVPRHERVYIRQVTPW
ncbi:hypothetical protein [Streptomyces rectiverticillatus]|uniref:hypothetical protein n=1 Tax=Streptomyces rectiverticillatus TaxID=173860 RepID=UPI001FEA7B4B|nr:hypothetical protein [Streptomyces rectiverticillatus]